MLESGRETIRTINIPYGKKDMVVLKALSSDINKLNLICCGKEASQSIGYINWVTAILSRQLQGLEGGVEYAYMSVNDEYDIENVLGAETQIKGNLTVTNGVSNIRHALNMIANFELQNRLAELDGDAVKDNLEYNRRFNAEMSSMFIIIDDLSAVLKDDKEPSKAIGAIMDILKNGSSAGIFIIAGTTDHPLASDYSSLFDNYLEIDRESTTIYVQGDDRYSRKAFTIDTGKSIKRKVKTPITGKTLRLKDTSKLNVKIPIMLDDDDDIVNLEVSEKKIASIVVTDSTEDNNIVFESIRNYCNLYLYASLVNYSSYSQKEMLIKELELIRADATERKVRLSKGTDAAITGIPLQLSYIRVNVINPTIEVEISKTINAIADCKMHLVISAPPSIVNNMSTDTLSRFPQYFKIDSGDMDSAK